MAFGRCLCQVSELILLVLGFALSLTVMITTVLLKNDFLGECPLYPTTPFHYLFEFETNDVSNCNYIIGINATAAASALYSGIFVTVEIIRNKRFISIMPLIKIVHFGILGILVMVSAGIISVGFKKMCDGLGDFDEHSYPYTTCKEWQSYSGWDIYYGYNGSHFYDYLSVAQIAAWINSMMWIVLTIITVITQACCSNQMGRDDAKALVT